MLMPSIFGEDLFDDLFDLPFYDDSKVEKKLYGRHAKNLMKTDIKEMDNGYELIIDLPGFKKDEIKVSLDNGYLSIAAAKGLDQDEQEKDTGKYIRRERYAGSCERSFYVGDDMTEEDIKGEFKHGILKLFVPKKEAKAAVPERKFIAIEGLLFCTESNLQTEKPIGIGKEGYIMADKNPKHMLKKKQVKAKDKKKHIYE